MNTMYDARRPDGQAFDVARLEALAVASGCADGATLRRSHETFAVEILPVPDARDALLERHVRTGNAAPARTRARPARSKSWPPVEASLAASRGLPSSRPRLRLAPAGRVA